MTPIDRALEKCQLVDRRPLVRNKTLYNRAINSMVTHHLESCISGEGNLEILSEVLTRLVYKSRENFKSTASLGRLRAMHDMIQRFSEKIIKDCQILKVHPSTVFEPPISLPPRSQVIAELEKHQEVIFKVKSEVNGNVSVPQSLIEKIGETVWGIKINPTTHADKYKILSDWANQWSMKKQTDKMKRSNPKNKRLHTLTMNVEVGLEKLKYEDLLGKMKHNENHSQSRKRPLETDDQRASKKPALEIPKMKISTPINKQKIKKEPGSGITHNKRLSIVSITNVSIPPVTENKKVDCGKKGKIASTSTINSSSSDKMDNALVNKTMVELITLMKTRDLELRKKDEEILQKLEQYLHSLNVANSV